MKKRFKGKKQKGRGKTILFLFLIITSFAVSLSFFSAFFQKEEVLNFLIESTLQPNQKKGTTLMDFLLDYTIGRKDIEEEVLTFSEGEYIKDPNPEENKKNPIIYIYNTHQSEEYKGDDLQEHDITPTVMHLSYKLREELNKKGINTIVETNPITEILRMNNWNYASSYKASKLMMQDAYEKNPTLKYFIDFHRDAIPYESSVATIGNKKYAKVLFVIGTDHEGYEENLSLAEKINEKLEKKAPGLSRGITKKGGAGVNGVYNQDFSSKTLLFEIGGQYNKISEVNNTVNILAEVLKEVVE